MRLSEAITALEAGKKVRRKGWITGFYIYNDPIIGVRHRDGHVFNLEAFLIKANDWEIVKEKKKVTLYRHTHKITGGIVQTGWSSLSSKDLPSFEIIKTETKEIEVDYD